MGPAVLPALQLVPAVTELMVAELLYLEKQGATLPIEMLINSSGTTRQDGEIVSAIEVLGQHAANWCLAREGYHCMPCSTSCAVPVQGILHGLLEGRRSPQDADTAPCCVHACRWRLSRRALQSHQQWASFATRCARGGAQHGRTRACSWGGAAAAGQGAE